MLKEIGEAECSDMPSIRFQSYLRARFDETKIASGLKCSLLLKPDPLRDSTLVTIILMLYTKPKSIFQCPENGFQYEHSSTPS